MDVWYGSMDVWYGSMEDVWYGSMDVCTHHNDIKQFKKIDGQYYLNIYYLVNGTLYVHTVYGMSW